MKVEHAGRKHSVKAGSRHNWVISAEDVTRREMDSIEALAAAASLTKTTYGLFSARHMLC